MSPEQHPSTPENNSDKPYIAEAQEVIARAGQNAPQTTERFLVVDAHVAHILEAGEAGQITGSRGTYSKEQLLRQFEDFLNELKIPEDQREGDPYNYIPGKDGLRASFKLLMENDATYRDLEESLKLHIGEEKEKRAELLSPQSIQEMGEAELTAAEVKEPFAEASRAAATMIEIPDFIRNPSGVSTPVEKGEPKAVSPEPSAEQKATEPETELQMYERFLAETQAELKELYAKHRTLDPKSYQAGSLENEIKHAKEDAGKFAKKVAQLKGGNWT